MKWNMYVKNEIDEKMIPDKEPKMNWQTLWWGHNMKIHVALGRLSFVWSTLKQNSRLNFEHSGLLFKEKYSSNLADQSNIQFDFKI